MGSSEDVLQALLEHLVEPLLPSKFAMYKSPPLSQQEMVAKQIHTVVLLYNYYQRKCLPEMEFLNFESFCKLAIILKPPLMTYMKLMHRSDYKEVDDLENQLSLTEKAIMDACDISLFLNEKKDNLNAKEWPICKVAVLLIDSRQETCFLLYDSTTCGVWSFIEKDFDISKIQAEDATEEQNKSKKRFSRQSIRDELNADESVLQQLALSAVNEALGVCRSDIVVLESHVVYSISKEKSAARFYIMQSTQTINQDVQTPLADLIECLRGQVVKKNDGRWMVSPVVKYSRLLPYAEVLSDWFSRRKIGSYGSKCSNLQDSSVNPIAATFTNSPHMENPRYKGIDQGTVMRKACSASWGTGYSGENTGKKEIGFVSPEREVMLKAGGSSVTSQFKSKYLDKQNALTSKENALSEAALNALYRTRQKLVYDLRYFEDEIALCDKKLKTILEGGEDALVAKLDAVIEGCDDKLLKSSTEMQRIQHLEDQACYLYMKKQQSKNAPQGHA